MRTATASILAVLTCVVGLGAAACVTGNAASSRSIDGSPAAFEADDRDSIPCEPRRVLETVCQKCHTRPPRNGAPFSLVTRTDIMRTDRDGQVRARMLQQLEARRMPLFPETIREEDRATLMSWLREGAPAITPSSCVDASTPEDARLAVDATEPAPQEAPEAGEPDAADPTEAADAASE